MGVFKEEANAFEKIAKAQRKIYSDAADFGVPFLYKNPSPDIKRIFDIINQLKDSDFIVRNRQEWKGGVSVDVIFFWEQDEGYYRGTKYSISFNYAPNTPSKIEKGYDSFISIDVEPYMEKA